MSEPDEPAEPSPEAFSRAAIVLGARTPRQVAQAIRVLVPTRTLEHWPAEGITALRMCAERLERIEVPAGMDARCAWGELAAEIAMDHAAAAAAAQRIAALPPIIDHQGARGPIAGCDCYRCEERRRTYATLTAGRLRDFARQYPPGDARTALEALADQMEP